MYLVAGSTGLVGSRICRGLRARGESVRALVRDSSAAVAVAGLKESGADIAVGDLQHPASLEAACAGVATVVSTATATQPKKPSDTVGATDRDGTLALIDAAALAGVERFVLISVSSNIDAANPLTEAKRTSEAALKASGMSYAILRASFFMDVWLTPAMGFDYAQGNVVVLGEGNAAVSWIHSSDVAGFAIHFACEEPPMNRTLELGGPEPLSPNTVVRIFEAAAGKPFEVTRIPLADLESEALAAEEADDDLARVFAALKLSYTRGDAIPMAGTLEAVPKKLISVSDYANSVMNFMGPG